MSQEDMVELAKQAKFKIEFMALMLISDRKDMAASAYEEALASLKAIIGEES